MSFKDKVVIVIGVSSGIGAAIAVAFSAEGAKVVMVGRNETKLAAVASRCSDPLVIRADISQDDDARHIIEKTLEEFGQINILINNAGISDQASLLVGDLMKVYDTVMSVNIRAVIRLTQLAAPHLIKTKGNVINISSVGGQIQSPVPFLMSYTISKAALNHFSICAAVELAPHGVRVNTISPGPVKTDILENSKLELTWDYFKKGTAFDRVSEPEEIADLALFLASDKAKAVTGSNYVSDNGLLIKRR